MSLPAFDPAGALRALVAYKVRFVVIGGLAGRLWGSPTVTNDLDICYSREPGNLVRLAAVLVELEARLRGVDEDLPFIIDAETLAAGDSFTFVTTAGNLDVLATPTGTQGFDGLVRAATEMDLGIATVLVVDVEDLIRMKRAAGRPKDLIEVEVLTALRDEL
ncbi:MAG: hypothetical protein H0V96_05835 [Acidimicrobiia bacterium]|nr:hypothetical protein [Acidimicrobiia bacterium]